LVSALGDAAGEVDSVVNNSVVPHAAVWDLNGTLRVLDQTPGHLTRAAAIADNGTVLAPPAAGGVFAAVNQRSLSVDGSTVVGSWTKPPAAGQSVVLRAFIYKQGLTQDLTDLAKAKGVKLPTGAYFSAVAGVNAKGSIVATYVDAKGLNPVQVRLTAVP
jgi:uncharacterized membrane protein